MCLSVLPPTNTHTSLFFFSHTFRGEFNPLFFLFSSSSPSPPSSLLFFSPPLPHTQLNQQPLFLIRERERKKEELKEREREKRKKRKKKKKRERRREKRELSACAPNKSVQHGKNTQTKRPHAPLFVNKHPNREGEGERVKS